MTNADDRHPTEPASDDAVERVHARRSVPVGIVPPRSRRQVYRTALRRWSLLAIALGTLGVAASELADGVWPVTLVTPLARQVAALFALGAIGLLILRFAWREMLAEPTSVGRRSERSLASPGPLKWARPVGLIVAIVVGLYAALVALGVVPWRIAPALAQVRAGDPDLGQLKVLSANVHSSNADHAALLKLIADERPDVVLLTEVNSAWLRSLKAIDADYPVRDRVADDFGNFGIGVWSRLPGEARLVVRQRLAAPSLLDVAHAEMTLRLNDRRVRIVGVHPLPPLTPARSAARDALLTSLADDVSRDGAPTIFAGDFNATRYCRISREIARRANLADATASIGTSWPMTAARPILGIRIDHVWATDAWRVVDAHAGPNIGSDHLPMVATLRLVRE